MSHHTLTRFAGIHTNWVNERSAIGAPGDPPWDLIMRAFVHYTDSFKKFPSPRLEATQWEVNTYDGERVVCDGEVDIVLRVESRVYLRDYNDDLMAEYTFDDKGRMKARLHKEPKLPVWRRKKRVKPSPELGKALSTLLK